MTACVIIVSAHRDMLSLCRAALRVHAPHVPVCIVATSAETRDWMQGSNDHLLSLPGARFGAVSHAAGIEYARSVGVGRQGEIIVLLDDDTVILSDRWWPMIETAFAVQSTLGVLGGVRSRGLIGQAYVEGMWLAHAHMMVLRRDIFEQTLTFHAEAVGPLGYVRLDTAAHACFEATRIGAAIRLLPFHDPGSGPCYPGILATEYYDAMDPTHTLWAHLGRGTSFAPQGRLRECIRHLAASLGSPRAAKILRRQDERRRFIERSWELLMGPRP